MRKGKMVSQGAHAALKVILDMMVDYDPWDDMEMYEYLHKKKPKKYTEKHLKLEEGSPLREWINGIFTKITCSCDSLEELKELYDAAYDAGLPCSMITDVGLTEFKGVSTITAIAIGPAENDKIDLITKDLKLL
jgi:peptidyl-tRNA hydrolase